MDLIKLVFASSLYILFSNAHSAVFDMGEHSGIIRDSNGNFSKVSSNGSVRSMSSAETLSFTEKVNFQTAKGVFSTDIVRTAAVDVARIGKTVRTVAVAGGPVGMTIAAVSLICDLTDICNQAGQWMLGADPALEGFPSTTPNFSWGGFNNQKFPSPSTACNSSGYLTYMNSTSAAVEQINETSYKCTFQPNGQEGYTNRVGSCADSYVLQGALCVLQGNSVPSVPTSTDWDGKESIMNDARFVPELYSKDQPIPVQTPLLPAPVTVPIGKETKTIKDGSGNVTGTEESTTEAKIEQPSPAENPTNNPNILKLSETTINNTYNINNQLTSSTSTVSSGDQKPQQQSFTVELDNVEKQPLEEKEVPMPLVMDSWGSGSCPADRQVSYHYGSLNLTFQPACDFATGIQPIVIILAGFIAMYIISGAMKND